MPYRFLNEWSRTISITNKIKFEPSSYLIEKLTSGILCSLEDKYVVCGPLDSDAL
jgi:hypothetical protein